VTTESALYIGSVMHRRFRPRAHRFRYSAFWLLLDLNELDVLSRKHWFFSHNRFNLLSLYETDHGNGSATPLREQVTQHLSKAGIALSGGTIRLLCMPRILGYCFNPISLYFCQRSDGSLAAMLYEVHNTFGERHSYLIPVDSGAGTIHQRCDKAFYVSPFLDMAMRYDFSLRAPGEHIAIAIRASQSDLPVMTACLSGTRKPLTDASLLRAFLMVPALTLKVTAAIHWEALRLWLKGLRLHNHPLPPKALVTAVTATSNRTD
jgi:uncharacterized protein